MMKSSLARGNLVGLLLGFTLGASVGGLSGAESIAKRYEDGGSLGLVECRPWGVCLRWPLMVVSEEGQCFIVLGRVRPGKLPYLPALMAENQVEGTGLPAEAWWRQTRALMLGRSYELVA